MSVRRVKKAEASSADQAACVADVLAALDAVAPLAGAESWDHVGLLAGRPEWPVERVLLAIDLTDAVAREALRKQVDAVVAYHPPIFNGIDAVTPGAAGPTSLLPDLLAAKVSVLSIHTAMDVAQGGTNDLLLDLFEIVDRRPLKPVIREDGGYKLVVFVPPGRVDALRRALAAAGAGTIGHYAECSFELAGEGTFRGDETTNPAVGRRGVFERVEETRLEMVVPAACVGDVVRALYATHPYEEPAYDLYPLHRVESRAAVGLGRVGTLRRALSGRELIERLAGRVDLSVATCVGELGRRFRSVTAAAGAFGVRAFRDPDSLVLTGEFKHHDALQLLRRNVTAICLGHYASERMVLPLLQRRLRSALPGARVTVARSDRSPFRPLPGNA